MIDQQRKITLVFVENSLKISKFSRHWKHLSEASFPRGFVDCAIGAIKLSVQGASMLSGELE